MTEPTFDADGYPTDETLEAIEAWPFNDRDQLFRFIIRAWKYPFYVHTDGRELEISTGGWSGNESLIYALQRNQLVWAVSWVQSRRGGHYIFETKEPLEE